ncbi:MAG: hypothetical protein HY926_08955 [Elusimicrobia bacterium]|nr:hypothetical protein [Elusimicrobiota bacterium]
MTRILLVAEGAAPPAPVLERLRREGGGDIALLWLGDGVPSGGLGCLPQVPDAARLLREETDRLREEIVRWSCDLGEAPACGGRVKDALLLPGGGFSTWWAGLLSEKNTLKSPLFHRLAQLGLARRVLGAGRYGRCFISVQDPLLGEALSLAAREADAVPQEERRSGVPWSVRHPVLRVVITAVGFWLRTAGRHLRLRLSWRGRARRIAGCSEHLCVSYFPLVDRRAAAAGRFLNRFTGELQGLAARCGKRLSWILVYIPLEGRSFGDALGLAREFSAKGENLFFWEEVLDLGSLLRAMWFWLRQAFIGERLLASGGPGGLVPPLLGAGGAPLTRALWRISFWGAGPMEGILYYAAFSAAWRRLEGVRRCVYNCEMLVLEKAINAARSKARPGLRTVGFQHSTLSRNFWSHFYDRRELVRSGAESDLPLPDVLAANGRLPAEMLEAAGYSVTMAESLRYLYLQRILSEPPRARRSGLLVIGSIDRQETVALLRFVGAAFPRAGDADILFAAHPALPASRLRAEIPPAVAACQGPLAEAMAAAGIVLSGASTAAFEALAYGCEVVVPVFRGVMFMNPIGEFPEVCHLVHEPEELRHVMERLTRGDSRHDPEVGRRFIRDYWLLDERMPRWRALLFAPEPREACIS